MEKVTHERPSSDGEGAEQDAKRIKLSPPLAASATVLPSARFNFSTSDSTLFRSLADTLGLTGSTEPQVGICNYLNPDLVPFHAIIKHRFTDFLVFEVTPDGQVLRLKDLNQPRPPPAPASPPSANPEASTASQPIPNGELWNPTSEALMATLFPTQEQLVMFETFVKAGPAKVEKGKFVESRVFVSQPVISKEERGTFHKTLREAFAGKIVSETKEIPMSSTVKAEEVKGEGLKDAEQKNGGEAPSPAAFDQVIVVSWKSPGGKDRVSKAERALQSSAPSNSEKPYIHLTLQKVNRESQDAFSTLARLLRLQTRDIGSAGTKDKRGVTVQRVSVKRGGKTLEDVWRACNGGGGSGRGGRGRGRGRGGYGGQNTGERGMKVADLTYEDKPLTLGGLEGNRFVITLRDVQSPSPEAIPVSFESLSKHGFINYYGMQRFGTAPIPTHAVGLALLRGDWKMATGLIMCEREGDGEDMAAVREAWKKGEVQKAAKDCPKRCVAEKAVLEHFARNGTADHLSALSKIPKNLRMMYVHAYQSFVFNRAVSERVDLWGANSPIVGDLVLTGAGTEEEAVVEDAEEEVVESLDPDLDDDEPQAATAPSTLPTSKIHPVKVLTQSDVDSGSFTVFDVVLPLPGFAVIYPENEMSEVFERIMGEDGVKKDEMFRTQKEYSLGGAYRHIVHLPKNVSHKLLLYSNPAQDLAQSDEDLLLRRTIPPTVPFVPTEGAQIPEGQSLAVQVDLTLGKGTFATMALREVLRNFTAAGFQKTLTAGMEERWKTSTAGIEAAELEAKKETEESTMEGVETVSAVEVKEDL